MQSCPPDIASEEDIVKTFIQITGNQLHSEWTRKKTPHGLYKAYALAEKDEQDSTNGIFRTASFRVWLAYWLVLNGNHHISGRATQLRILSTFNKLPNEKKRSAAAALAAIIPHPTVENAIRGILTKWKTEHRK